MSKKISKAAKIAEYDRRQSEEYWVAQEAAAGKLRAVLEGLDAEKVALLAEYLVASESQYRIVRNIMSKKAVVERADLPYSCSVASEAYWQN